MKGLQSSKIEREQRLKLSRMKESKREQRADTHKPKRKQFKTIARILIFFLFSTSCGGFLSPRIVFAEALPDLPLEFDPDITFADNVISFMAASGAATTNVDVLNDLYTNFSGSGYGVADLAGLYDVIDVSTGLSVGLTDAEIISHLGDQDYFVENGYDLQLKDYNSWKQKLDTSQSLSKYGAELIHEATLSDTGNPWEWDWSEIIKTYLKRGDIPFAFDIAQKDIGTTITRTMADVLDNIISYWSGNINNGVGIDVTLDPTILQTYNIFGYANVTINDGRIWQYVFYGQDGIIGALAWDPSSTYQTFHLGFYNTANTTIDCKYAFNASNLSNVNLAPYTFQATSRNYIVAINTNLPIFQTVEERTAYFNSFKDSEDLPYKNTSPDLINPNFSNLDGEDLERMAPSIEQGQALRPIPQSDYDTFKQNANNNTNNDDVPDNAPLMTNFLDPYINTDPDPNPNPNPNPNPDPNTRPVSPEQPDYPDEPELTDEDINESLKAVTPDLTDIFPFCIPWDIKAIFTKFSASRQAPYFEFPIKSELFGIDEVIIVDFSMFDDQAEILRYLELILFVIALAVATRKLIGA